MLAFRRTRRPSRRESPCRSLNSAAKRPLCPPSVQRVAHDRQPPPLPGGGTSEQLRVTSRVVVSWGAAVRSMGLLGGTPPGGRHHPAGAIPAIVRCFLFRSPVSQQGLAHLALERPGGALLLVRHREPEPSSRDTRPGGALLRLPAATVSESCLLLVELLKEVVRAERTEETESDDERQAD